MIFKNRQDNDPFFNNVSLLLHMDGANGSTTFTDSSSNNFAVTANGNAQISSAQSKFGGSSALFDGAGDYLQVGSSTIQALQFPADFTLEMWYYPLSLSINQCLYDASLPAQSSTRADGFALAINTSGQMYFFHNGAPSYTSSHPTINTWNHIVVSRSGSALRVFLNGNIVLTLTNSVNFSRGGALIGTITETLGAFTINGYIDELRITKGVAIYTGNFTPPTTPFPDREIKRTIFKKNGSNNSFLFKSFSSPGSDTWSTVFGSDYSSNIVAAYDFRDGSGSVVPSKIGPELQTAGNISFNNEGALFTRTPNSSIFSNSTISITYPHTLVYVGKTINNSNPERVIMASQPIKWTQTSTTNTIIFSRSQGLLPFNGVDNSYIGYAPNGTEWYFIAISFNAINGASRYAVRKVSGNLNGTIVTQSSPIGYNGFIGFGAGLGSATAYNFDGTLRLAMFINQSFLTENDMNNLFDTILSGPASDLELS